MRNATQRLLAAVTLSTAAAVVAAFAGMGAAEAAPAEGPVRGANASGAIKDNYIVVFKPGSAESRAVDSAATRLGRKYGGAVKRAYTSTVHGFSVKLTEKAAKRLAADPAVDYVEQDRTVKVTGTQTATPSWGLDRIDQTSLPLNSTYTYPTTATNVTAYIIDTGVRISHTDFAGRAYNCYDFIDNDTAAGDCAGHGTHVAGTIGGNTYGVAKGVKLVAVRVLDCQGSGSYSQIIAGVDWVTRNAVKPAVANMSLGGSAGTTLDNAVKASIASGVTYAVAAGNDNTNACDQSPARLADAITVAATDKTDKRSSFSNYGTCVDIFAPGTGIKSDYNSGDTATTTMSGTSMATPHVAGAAALYLSAHPTATPAQVRDDLVANAQTGKVTNAGTGTPNKLLDVTKLALAPVTPVSVPTAPVTCKAVANSGNFTIRDKATVESPINVTACSNKASRTSKVTVDVKHSDRGDLAIWLIAPDGTLYKLKSSTSGDDHANVKATYTVNLSSENRRGIWRLRVQDRYTGDTGWLDRWSIAL